MGGRTLRRLSIAAAGLMALSWNGAIAGEADVTGAVVKKDRRGGTYSFTVSVRHEDAGWKHYADSWDVVAPDGTVLDTLVLRHPHVREQPFTRTLGGVSVPDGIDYVVIRAHDKVHGLGGKELRARIER